MVPVENPRSRIPSEAELLGLIPTVDSVLASTEPYTSKVLRAAKRLKVISRVGVGYNNIDLAEATRLGISVTWTPIPELAYAVAEHAFALMLALARRLPQALELPL